MQSDPLENYRPSVIEPDVVEQVVGPETSVRPGGLTAICVIVIVIGCLGGLAALGALPGMLLGTQMDQMGVAFSGGMPEGQRDAYVDMVSALAEVQSSWLPITLPAIFFGVVVAVALVVGGVRALGRNPKAGDWLRRILMFTIIVDIARTVANAAMQMDVSEVTAGFMAKMMSEAEGGVAVAVGMEQMMGVMAMVGVVFAAIWLLIKIAFYGFAFAYVGRAHVQAYFGSRADGKPPATF